MTKLYNAARFVASSTEGFDYSKFDSKKAKFRQPDLWILSRLNSTIQEATESLEKYEFSKAMIPVRNFFWLEFADYYIEEIKYRIYNADDPSRKEAQYCLVKVFTDVLKMLAPFMPHLTEEIMQRDFKKYMKTESIHLEKWPSADKRLIKAEYEEMGKIMNNAISLIRKEKSGKNISLNSPVKTAVITVLPGKANSLNKTAEEIRRTMNIEVIEIVEGNEEKAEITQ